MKRLSLVTLLMLCALSVHAQGVRFSSQVSQQGTAATSTNVVILPSSPQISFCNAPANAVPCTNKATTYTNSTLGTACSTSTQIVLDGATTCVASPDSQNNWGVWLSPGQYAYTITLNGTNSGPYYVSVGNQVASLTLPPQSASIGQTTFVTVPVAGMYRLTVDIITTTAGTGGNASATITYNNGSTSSSTGVGGTANLALLGSENNLSNNDLKFYSAASQPVQYAISNSGSTGLYQLRLRLEYLGP